MLWQYWPRLCSECSKVRLARFWLVAAQLSFHGALVPGMGEPGPPCTRRENLCSAPVFLDRTGIWLSWYVHAVSEDSLKAKAQMEVGCAGAHGS